MLIPELDPLIYSPRLQSHTTRQAVIETCEHIRTHCGGALGFFPISGFRDAISRDRLLAVALESEICVGFILWTRVRHRLQILAIGVEEDYRRYGIGTRLLQAACWVHRKDRINEVTLRCREDLEANAFWLATEHQHVETIKGNNKLGLKLNRYQKLITEENT